jgi:hypothetical protein
MTGPFADDPGEFIQESLLHPAEEAAMVPPGLVPDPLVMVQFVTGVGAGHSWHAIDRELAEHPFTQAAGGMAAAVCGAAARVTKYGVYDRVSTPVTYEPCQVCAWTVAIATGSTERELRLNTPGDRAAGALARAGADPLLVAAICRAVLACESSPGAEQGLDHPATAQILAHATAHRPVAAIAEDCAEDSRSCRHRPDEAGAGGEDWRCDYPGAEALCLACSLRAGSWAGEWEGDVMDECRVRAPCGVLRALAARYGVAAAGPGGRGSIPATR